MNQLDDDDREWESAQWLRPELIAPWWEIVLVLIVMLGPFAYSSASYALKGHTDNFISHIVSTHGFLRQTVLEAGLLSGFFFYLHWRGWRPADFKIRIDWKGTLFMPSIAIGAGLANIAIALALKVGVAWLAPHPHGIAAALTADAPHIPPHSIVISWSLIYLVSIVNAYLEELVFMGYAFNQFAARRGPLFALFAMVLLRMLLHTYKGPLDMIGISGMAFTFGLAYIYLRRLWPLILGHACIDILAFSVLKIFFGR